MVRQRRSRANLASGLKEKLAFAASEVDRCPNDAYLTTT
jgi:hypothetical protein